MCDLSHCCGCGNAIRIPDNKPGREAVCMIKEVPIEDIEMCPLDEVTVSLDLQIPKKKKTPLHKRTETGHWIVRWINGVPEKIYPFAGKYDEEDNI